MSSRIILLGTGTGLPDPDRAHTHLVWAGPGGPLLIDVGGETYRRLLAVEIEPQQLKGVILTHSHCDHINGLPALLFSLALGGRTEPLPIYGLPETIELAADYVAAAGLGEWAALAAWRSVYAGDTLHLDDGLAVATALTAHSRPCLALRIIPGAGKSSVCYSADTEPCPSVTALATGARLLIHEATTAEPFPGHTTPRQAGAVAAAAGVERLVLVHFSPRWTMPIAQALTEVAAGGFTGHAQVGEDLQVIELEM
ncbi:MBL fold metallo-hydrolase [Chloroflexus sp.]|uniref:MBL fold metallo-hydrolase n=1 Tax=Chloroflexus sp. TaxID=1904827 RepID=UPI00261E3D8C|nr:MBL fold metallo-hydrolase [uncultured Chloroflexus sp.]